MVRFKFKLRYFKFFNPLLFVVELKNEHLDKDSVLNIIKSSKENINLKKYFGDEYYADDEYYMYANNAMNILQHSKILFVVNLFLYINVHSLIVVVF